MSQFVTISRKDQQFWPMLTGKFSTTHFAQPIKTLYVNSSDEMVTFKIVEGTKPSLLKALAQWYSLARNIYLVFPILGVVSYLYFTNGALPWVPLVVAFLSLQFFLMALTLYNDYLDYIHGVDRVNEYNFNRPLIQGLIRPFQAKQLAYVFFALAVGFASYCIYYRPGTALFALAAFLIGYIFSTSIISKKFKGLSGLTSFLLAGPLLVLGYEFLLVGTLSVMSVLIGFIYGLHALKYDFCKQLREVFYNSKANVITMSTFLGFEKSRFFYSFLSIAHLILLFSLFQFIGGMVLPCVIVVALGFEFYINRLLHGATSFLSSDVSNCIGLQKLHYTIENVLLIFAFYSASWIFIMGHPTM